MRSLDQHLLSKSSLSRLMTLVLMLVVLLLTSCLPSSNSGGRKSKVANSKATSDVADPDNEEDPLSEDLNFLQQSATTTTSTLTLGLNFADSFFLRGNEIHHYLDDRDTSVVVCFVAYFPTSTSNKLMVLAASSQNVFNFTNGTREYYLSMQSTDEDQNTGYCQTSGMSTRLSTLYPGATKAYLADDVCNGCTGAFTSTSIALYDTTGNALSDISLTHLSIKLDSSIDANAGGSNPLFCSTNTECESEGYNCCSSGQCVNDGQLKQTYSAGDPLYSDYLQAIVQATAVPASFSLYPDFFYVCGVDPLPTAVPAGTIDADATAAALFDYKQELYNCIVPGADELSICTVRYPTPLATIASGTTAFKTTADDRNFSDTNMGSTPIASTKTTITKVVFGGTTLYDVDAVPTPTGVTLGNGNDTLSSQTTATLTFTPSSSAPDTVLKISYKLDGSCTSINSYLAQCTKYYVMGQATGAVSDHVTTSQYFDIPDYADTSRSMTVYVDGARVYSGIQYSLTTNGSTGNNSILFNTGYNIQSTQEVKIVYYVSKTTYPYVVVQRDTALSEVNSMCDCGGNTCSLAPVYEDEDDETSDVVDYQCVYPTAAGSSTLPLQTTVYINSKSVPVRYFDINGVAKDSPKTTDNAQEGTPFAYTNSDVLRPNNMTTTIGFNEIYGSLNPASADAPQAPVKVDVVKNRTYDLFSDGGSFATCQNCGTDYYTSLAKFFPDNFLFWSAGYAPDPTRTSRSTSTYFFGGEMRADDMLFGRACWLPATMIPWTHNEGSTQSATTNRRNRMAAQHFLFANGYQRDWFGFDYGALIGSFDGVSWFAIGNQRRIKASGNKLYLAINAYFGDLTTSATHTLTINEVTSYTGSYVDYDDESDGAECRAYHFCESDQDCVTQLGWDYTCDDVSGTKTTWPTFDSNGNEIPQTANSFKTLSSIVGGTNGQNKRCIYRGRGAPCTANYDAADATTSYNRKDSNDSQACVLSNYCASLTASKFNNSISRFGKSPANQNASSYVTIGDQDTFGLAARVLGRPLHFNGTSAANTTAKTNLNAASVTNICIPGHETNFSTSDTDTASDIDTYTETHDDVPDGWYEKGDRVLNIGHTYSSTSTSSDFYYASCPTFNDDGNLYHLEYASTDLNDSTNEAYYYAAAGQNLSTNLLHIFDSPALPVVTPFGTATPGAEITYQVLETNRCMRAPGAACFSDWDCGPSSFIAGRLAGFDTASAGGISEHELEFWSQDMICSNAGAYTYQQQDFDLKENRCCRDVNKEITIATYVGTPDFSYRKIAGVNTLLPINDVDRYSRIVALVAKSKPEAYNPGTLPEYPYLYSSIGDETSNDIVTYDESTISENEYFTKQWKSFDYLAGQQCCTKNWVRNFDSDDNGGGHTWDPAKMQNFTKSHFECINYLAAGVDSNGAYSYTNCDDPDNQDETECSLRYMTSGEVEEYSKFFSSLELIGIPQVYIKTPFDGTVVTGTNEQDDYSDIGCTFIPDSLGTSPGDINRIIPGTLRSLTSGATETDYAKFIDLLYTDSRNYYSAGKIENFSSDLKKVFDDDKVTCCLPAGVQYDHDIEDDMCCTGKAYDDGDTTDKRCCLPDYTNISLYLNRYISSEANYLTDEMFDPITGSIKDASVAMAVASAKNLCCSGSYAVGVAAGFLPIPVRADGANDSYTNSGRTRFIFSDESYDSPNNDYFDYGLRWPTDVYCVPAGVTNESISSGSGVSGSGSSTSSE